MPLNERRQRFVAEYLKDPNAKQAAIRAGYSERTAEQQGSRLLGFVEVQEAIDKGRKRLAERSGITQEKVLARIWDMAEATETPDVVRMRGYELAGKHLGMFTERVHHEGNVGVTVVRHTPALDEGSE